MSIAEAAVRKVLNKIIKENRKNGEISLRTLSSACSYYTSSLLSATVRLKNEEDLKLFAKVAHFDVELRQLLRITYQFKIEQFVYTELVEVYESIHEKHNVPLEFRFIFPKFYGGDDTDGKETIVLEDLVSRGYTAYGRFQLIDWEHIECAVKALARFHALSFAFAKEDPDNFIKTLGQLKMRYREGKSLSEAWLKMIRASVQVAKVEDKEKISKFLDHELSVEEFYKFRTPISTPVICHGDFKVCNLLFKDQVSFNNFDYIDGVS